MPTLEADPFTLSLTLACVAVFLLANLLTRKGAPLLHPILLQRQGDASKVRNEGESAVWTHQSATGGMFVVRPENNMRGLRDVIEASSHPIKDKVKDLAAHLHSLAGSEQAPKRLGILLDNPQDILEYTLACSYIQHLVPVVLGQASDYRSGLVDHVLTTDAIYATAKLANVKAYAVRSAGLTGSGDKLESIQNLAADSSSLLTNSPPANVNATAVQFLVSGATVSLSNLNVTAAVYNLAQAFGTLPKNRLSRSDKVMTTYSASSPFGFASALAAVYAGVDLHFEKPQEDGSILDLLAVQRPTVLYVDPGTAKKLADVLQFKFRAGTPFPSQVFAAKLWALRQGALDRHILWDGFFLNKFRKLYKVDSIRAVVVYAQSKEDLLSQNQIDNLRILLGAVVVHGLVHPQQPVPLTSSHIYDFQFIPTVSTAFLATSDEAHHVGPPSTNVRIKLRTSGEAAEKSRRVQGDMLVNGPSLSTDGTTVKDRDGEMWTETGLKASVATNGVFRLL